MAGPSDIEQLMLEYINDARLDPLGDAARYIRAYGTVATSGDTSINNGLSFFKVNGPALLAAFQALTPTQPLAWNDTLAAAARTHDQAMIAADTQAHQLPGEAGPGDRALAAGYNFSNLGENIFAYSESPLEGQAALMVDWGTDANGMQTGAGHRVNIMNPIYREVGVGIVADTNNATEVGPQVTTEDFGTRSGVTAPFVLGVAYNDADHNDFYSLGEGVGTLQVAIGSASIGSYATGGYTLVSPATGAQTITFTGGGLASAVTVVATLAARGNYKIDIVNGTELKSSVSAVVGGPITTLEVLGVVGISLTATGSTAHVLIGNGGDDTLVGGSGNDTFDGGAGNNIIVGGDGADILKLTAPIASLKTVINSDASVTISGTGFSDRIQGVETIQLQSGTATQTYTLAQFETATSATRVIAHYAGRTDFDGDGHSDILWRNINGAVSTWSVAGDGSSANIRQGVFNGAVDPSWTIVETADFNGDGRSDILWRNTNGTFSIWNATTGGGFTPGGYTDGSVGNDWTIAATGDVNGDGRDDILWRSTSGAISVWQSSGAGFAQNTYFHASPGAGWSVEGLGDFNGDGKADILWRNSNGGVASWVSTGNGFTEGGFFAAVDTRWHVDGIADINGDGRADILWRNDSGALSTWSSNGAGFDTNSYFNNSVGTDWTIAALEDFNADGKADILWRNDNGALSTWQSNGGGFDASVANATAPTSWSIIGHHFIL